RCTCLLRLALYGPEARRRSLSCLADCLCIATAPPLLYPLSLHDALPICRIACWTWMVRVCCRRLRWRRAGPPFVRRGGPTRREGDRKSTRLNSSHVKSSYAVFCLRKKTKRSRTRNTAALACCSAVLTATK